MENKAHALAVGIFTVVLAAAAFFTLWWLSGRREAMREYELVTLQNVNGLNLQAQVRYRGIRAGKVLDIDIDPKDRRFIVVRISVDSDMPVTKSTVAKLKYQGVTGLAYVQLEDSGESREPLESRDGQLPRIPLKASAFDDIADAALNLVEQLQKVAERANRVLSDSNLQRIEGILAGIGQASDSLDAALKDVSKVSDSLRQVLNDQNLRRIDQIIVNLDKAGAQAAPLAADLRNLVATMQNVARRLEEFSGGAGGEMVKSTLPRANELLQELTGTSRQLSRLLQQIEEKPNMLIFGRGNSRQPGPGEAGFSPPPVASPRAAPVKETSR